MKKGINRHVAKMTSTRRRLHRELNQVTPNEEEHEEYEVEAILGEKKEDGITKFQVKWKGYDEPDWEPEANLSNSKALITSFRRKKNKQNKEKNKAIQEKGGEEADERGSAEAEEYVIDKILDMKFDAGKRQFLIQWQGYEEATWEPENNLPADSTKNFMAGRTKNAVCFFCNVADGAVARNCETCGKPMHHFCYNDNFSRMNTPEGDKCYCSNACYSGKGEQCSKRKRKERVAMSSEDYSRNDEDEEDVQAPDFDEDNEDDEDFEYGDDLPSVRQQASWKSNTQNPPQKKPKKTTQALASTSTASAATSGNECGKSLSTFDFYLKHVAFSMSTEKSWIAPKKDDMKKLAGLSDVCAIVGVIKSRRQVQTRTKACNDDRDKDKTKKLVEFEYEVHWTSTRYQASSLIRFIPETKVLEGMAKYQALKRAKVLQWEQLQEAPRNERMDIDFDPDEMEVLENFEELETFDGPLHEKLYEEYARELKTHEDVERIKGLDFRVDEGVETPKDLFRHADGSTESRVKGTSRAIFTHDLVSSSFFAYLPRVFWSAVVVESNKYAGARNQRESPITLQEMMSFLGILLFMAVFPKGEMSNYWGVQPEEVLPNVGSLSVDGIMTRRRFKYIRSNLCFNFDVTPEKLKHDPVARIRPLINTLKRQSQSHMDIGRNISVDEASIACRSKFARGLIVYNSTKPTGKYHFKLYVCCCARTWLAFAFKLHCSANIHARLEGTQAAGVVERLKKEMEYVAEVRKHVLEVTEPAYKSNRIVNMDNYYTSPKLLFSLKSVGLYGRGTVRKSSQHFPKFIILNDKDAVRGDMSIAVNTSTDLLPALGRMARLSTCFPTPTAVAKVP